MGARSDIAALPCADLVADRAFGELSLEGATVHAEAAGGGGNAPAAPRTHALYVLVSLPINRQRQPRHCCGGIGSRPAEGGHEPAWPDSKLRRA